MPLLICAVFAMFTDLFSYDYCCMNFGPTYVSVQCKATCFTACLSSILQIIHVQRFQDNV